MKPVHTIKDYIFMNDVRRNTTSVLTGGLWYFFVGEQWINEASFNELRPSVEYKPYNEKGVNPCRKNNYISNTKSY